MPASPASLPALSLELTLTLDNQPHSLRFLVPAAMLEAPTGSGRGAADRVRVAERIATGPVKLRAVLAKVRLSVAELSGLQVGDCVVLDQPLDQPVSLYLNHVEAFRARPGREGGKLACKITEVLKF
jgi:flagellar motor switch protein FliM